MYEDKLTVLVTSCKGYEDVLDIHEKLFKKFWSECPFKRMLVMDEVSQNADYLNNFDDVLICGKETGAKNHLRITRALERITTPYVIFLQEDMLLQDNVDNDRIYSLLDFVKRVDAGALRLIPFWGRDDYCDIVENTDGDIFEYTKEMPYRVSYTPSIWNREQLYDISKRYEYGADFERQGSEYCKNKDIQIFGCKYVAYPYYNGILRGKWELQAVRNLSYYKIIPDFTKHALMTPLDICKQGIMGYIFNISPNKVLKIQNYISIGKKN